MANSFEGAIWGSLIITEMILVTFLILSCQQLCCIVDQADTTSLLRAAYIVVLLFLFVILNTIWYLSAVYPYPIWYFMIEPFFLITILIGFQMSKTFIKQWVVKHIPDDHLKQKIVRCLCITQATVSIIIVVGFLLVLILDFDNEIIMVHVSYFVLYGMTIIVAIIFIMILKKIKNEVGNPPMPEENRTEIESLLKTIKIVYIGILLMFIWIGIATTYYVDVNFADNVLFRFGVWRALIIRLWQSIYFIMLGVFFIFLGFKRTNTPNGGSLCGHCVKPGVIDNEMQGLLRRDTAQAYSEMLGK